MSENAGDGTREAPDNEDGPQDGPEKRPSEKPPDGEAARDSEERRNDLIVEQWQDPRPSQMAGGSREIWEYGSEDVRPSGSLWFNLFAVLAVLLGGLALVIYGLWRLVSWMSLSGSEIP